jgi:hypothetical protein
MAWASARDASARPHAATRCRRNFSASTADSVRRNELRTRCALHGFGPPNDDADVNDHWFSFLMTLLAGGLTLVAVWVGAVLALRTHARAQRRDRRLQAVERLLPLVDSVDRTSGDVMWHQLVGEPPTAVLSSSHEAALALEREMAQHSAFLDGDLNWRCGAASSSVVANDPTARTR